MWKAGTPEVRRIPSTNSFTLQPAPFFRAQEHRCPLQGLWETGPRVSVRPLHQTRRRFQSSTGDGCCGHCHPVPRPFTTGAQTHLGGANDSSRACSQAPSPRQTLLSQMCPPPEPWPRRKSHATSLLGKVSLLQVGRAEP